MTYLFYDLNKYSKFLEKIILKTQIKYGIFFVIKIFC